MPTGKEIGGEGGSFANPNTGLAQQQLTSSDSVSQFLIKKKNPSGTHKPSPHMLHNLINNLKGIPLNLFAPGAAALGQLLPMLQGIMQAAKMLGGLHNVGNAGSGSLGATMGKIGKQLGAKGKLEDLTQAQLLALMNAPNAANLVAQMIDGVGGPGIAGGLAAMSFGDQSNIMNIVDGTPGQTDSHDNNPDPTTIPQVTPPIGTTGSIIVADDDKASIGMLDNMVMDMDVDLTQV